MCGAVICGEGGIAVHHFGLNQYGIDSIWLRHMSMAFGCATGGPIKNASGATESLNFVFGAKCVVKILDMLLVRCQT